MTEPSVDSQVSDLQTSHKEANARLKNLRRVGSILTAVLAVVIVGFVVALYAQVTTMYTAENFEEPLRQEGQRLLTKLEPELMTLWAETAPVYSNLVIDKLAAALPELQRASEQEMATLLANLGANAQVRINESLERVSSRQNEVIKQHFTRLSTQDGAEELGMEWMETVVTDLEEIVPHFHKLYLEDLGQLQSTLEQFRNRELERMPKDKLTRHFVHLWLMKADNLVQHAGQDRSVEGGNHAG